MTIPRGWDPLPVANIIPGRASVKEYMSLDGTASILLAAIPVKKNDAKEVSRRWMLRRSTTMLTHRWGKKDSHLYYWARGRDKNDNVFELYAFERDGHIVIIEGISPVDRYALLRKKLEGIFASVKY